nr:hypothetical protein [Tissierella praeacuta]
MSRMNNIFKNILCLLIAILVSFMEVQFFSETSVYSIALIVVLGLTIHTIYLYFLPKHETMIIFLYNIILVYLLDFLGKKVDIKLFLVTLFFIVLLFAHSLYTANAQKTKLKNPSYLGYIITLVIILLIVSLFTLYIYEYILKPNVNEHNQLALVYENRNNSNEEMNNIQEKEVDNNSGGNGGGGGSIDEPIDIKAIIKWIIIILFILIAAYILYRIIKYRLWLMKTLKLSREEQVIIFYKYFLRALSVLGFEKSRGETPYEYMHICESQDFPFDKYRFGKLTDGFINCKYGGKSIVNGEYEEILEYFYSISKSIRENIGIKDYLTKYLIKVKV